MKKLYIANWKMERSFEQQCALVQEYIQKLKSSTQNIVICPTFPALYHIKQILQRTDSSLLLGAQGCSPHPAGPYTGQVSAQSLAQIGCTYCIIGHSEWRGYTKASNEIVAQQYKQLLDSGIIPIICISDKEIDLQLSLINAIKTDLPVYIAYEPLWAIGTGEIPTKEHLKNICTHIRALMQSASLHILYGGSVNTDTIANMYLPELDGYLIGSASLDVQKLKNIVSYS